MRADQITPEWLRKQATLRYSTWIPIFASAGKTLALALELADGAARSDIETMCASVKEDGGEPVTVEEIRAAWNDTKQILDPEDAPYVKTALEYLEGRGLLIQHPVRVGLVRFKDVPGIAEAACQQPK